MQKVTIAARDVIGPNDRFWAAAGLDELFAYARTQPGEYLLRRMREKGTCRYVRNHYTLNREFIDGLRCGGDVYHEDAQGNPVYDFTWINEVFSRFVEQGIKPIVELDFIPDALIGESGGVTQEGFGHAQGNRFCPGDWEKWDALLRAFVQNLAEVFGLEEIRSWYFEVWNEPDSWPVEAWPQFFRLYDVFAHAVRSVDDQLRVGGPACFKMPLFYAFLDHAANGTNFVTGKKDVPLDFISYHIYGMSGAWLDDWPLVMPTVQRFVQELLWVQRAIDVYPKLSKTEFMLNEWGVVSNYERTVDQYPPLEIRNSEYSALFLVKLVDCVLKLRRQYALPLSVMLYWGFCGEDSCDLLFNGNRSLTTAGNICKPVQTAHEMLAMLGDEQLKTEGLQPGGDEGVIAARSSSGVQVLLYAFNEYDPDRTLPARSYDLHLTDLENAAYRLRVYRMDDTHNNTYRLWQRMGSPKHPDEEMLEKLRAEQEITFDEEETVTVTDGCFSRELSLPTVSMTLLCLDKID